MKRAQSIPSGTSQTIHPPDQIQDRIRQRAHEIYEARGRDHGHDMDDWLTAESEVTRNFTAQR